MTDYLGWRNRVEVAEASHIDRMEEVEADRVSYVVLTTYPEVIESEGVLREGEE